MKKPKPKKAKEKPKEESKPTQVENEKPFDFGGIPERDLKKNLGCG